MSAPTPPTAAQKRNLENLKSRVNQLFAEAKGAQARLLSEGYAAWGLIPGVTMLRNTKTGIVGFFDSATYVTGNGFPWVSVRLPKKSDGTPSKIRREWYTDWELAQ